MYVRRRQLLFGIGVVVLISGALSVDPDLEDEEIQAIDFLRYMDGEIRDMQKENLIATFQFDTNMTKINRKAMYSTITESMKFIKELWKESKSFNWKTYKDPNLKRQFWLYSNLGLEALPEAQYKRLMKITLEMSDILNSTKIPSFEDPVKAEITFDPDIKNILATSSHQNELQHTYNEYVRLIGEKTKSLFKESVDILNDAAKLNGFADAGEASLVSYEDPNLKLTVQNLYKDIKPLYTLVHSYVRYKLRAKFGETVSKNGPIPVHLTGSLTGENFENLYNLVKPFPDVPDYNFDENIKKQSYDVEKILKQAEDFYISLNMTELPELFWNNSVFHKAENTKMSCFSKSYNMGSNEPRLKTCVELTRQGLRKAHQDVGKIEYLLQFGDLSHVYRNWANEAFGDAVGASVSLSFMSLRHARKLNLTNSESSSEATKSDDFTDGAYLNNALLILLQTLPYLAYTYAIEMWRWDVFNGNITEEDYNCHWWKFVEDFQGLEAPTDRLISGFDVFSDYHLVFNEPSIKYFIGKILEFQIYKSLCLKSKEYTPHIYGNELYKCDFYGSTTAGNDLKSFMSLGSSKPWTTSLEMLTGQHYFDSDGILEYFKPLQVWLEDEIERLNIPIGWIKSTKVCH